MATTAPTAAAGVSAFPVGSKVDLLPFTPADVTPAYLSWLNDPVTMRLSNQRFLHHDEASSLRYLRTFEGSPNFFFSMREKAGGRAIGTMTAYLSPQHLTADMGILVGERAAWGQGFGLDAWKALMAWLFTAQGVRKVTAGTLDCNNAMLSLARSSGMAPDGRRLQQELVDGEAHDIVYFARFRDA